ncbi:hypothetical protein [Peribacillus sp. SCS-155]|uniref:hypothetical protein n=1 Tax=Peribacillus sedimenti TaxID=3115297 RepID=UPI0039058264
MANQNSNNRNQNNNNGHNNGNGDGMLGNMVQAVKNVFTGNGGQQGSHRQRNNRK